MTPPRHSGKTADAVRCEVISVTFASIPKYEALSYTWGEEDATRTIELNHRSFRVRKNLYDALYHLRNNEKERVIWVDAICINQNDNDERSCQVSIMPSIYSRAQKVLVWLRLGTSYEDPCKHPYWSRLWILQEIGLAHRLDICQGDQVITWNTFLDQTGASWASFAAARKVVKFRENRHKDLRLELLLEKCQRRCSRIVRVNLWS